MKNIRFLNGNVLKMIALVTMTIDHAGLYIFGNMTIMRIIGRIAFPIYAYMIAEGCRYTKNKKIYFFNIFFLGLLYQAGLYLIDGSLEMCVLITYSFSILIIYALMFAKSKKNSVYLLIPAAAAAAAFGVCSGIPALYPSLDFSVDYGFLGVLVPVFISLSDDMDTRLVLAAFSLSVLAITSHYLQWYSLLALIPLFFYNGERGKLKLKSFFYIYYPLHMAVIALIGTIV